MWYKRVTLNKRLIFLSLVLSICSSLSQKVYAGDCPPILPEPNEKELASVAKEKYKNRLVALECHINQRKQARAQVISVLKAMIFGRSKLRITDEKKDLIEKNNLLAEFRKSTHIFVYDLRRLKPSVDQVIADFFEHYQSTAKARDDDLERIAKLIPKLDRIESIQTTSDLIRLDQEETVASHQFQLAINRIIFQELRALDEYHNRLESLNDFINKNELKLIESGEKIIEILRTFAVAIEQRTLDYHVKIKDVLAHLREHQKGINIKESQMEIKEMTLRYLEEQASNEFIREVTTATSRIHLTSLDKKFGLLYLEEPYIKRKELMFFDELCFQMDSVRPSWMNTGCELIRPALAEAKVFFKKIIPRRLKNHLSILKKLGFFDETVTDSIRSFVNEGDLLSAVQEHDLFLKKLNEEKR